MDEDAARVLTYNVRLDTPEDDGDVWEERREAVASTIRFHRPALVGLQEPLAHQYRFLRERLPAFEWIGASRGAGEGADEFVPVGVRADRFAVLDAGTFWLSETPEEPGSVGWDAAHPRIATWARLRDRRTGDRLAYCNTHLDHDGETARVEGARLVRRRVASLADGAPAVVSGDLNCERGDPPHRALTAGDWRDARAAAARPHGPPTSRTDFERLVPDRLIDHVVVAPGLRVEQCGTCTDADRDGRYPSDHLPVAADVRPEGGSG